MKKAAAIFLTVLLGVCLLMPLNAFGEDVPTPPAADAAQPPVEETLPTEAATEAPTQIAKPELTEITFEGGTINGTFNKDVFEYQLILSEQTAAIRPASYKCTDYNAMVQVYYLTNASGDAIGLVVRVYNAGGSNEYKFMFDSVKEIKKTPDASLLSLTFDFGELSPKFDAGVYRYTLYLPKDLEVLHVNAVPMDENAKVGTPSQITLSPEQSSSISVKITSSDGTNTLTYKLNIKRVDKTIAQIKAEMEDPDFTSFVETPFYQTAPFYITLAGTLFLIALGLVLFFTLRKKKMSVPNTDLLPLQTVPQAENAPPLPETAGTVLSHEALPAQPQEAPEPAKEEENPVALQEPPTAAAIPITDEAAPAPAPVAAPISESETVMEAPVHPQPTTKKKKKAMPWHKAKTTDIQETAMPNITEPVTEPETLPAVKPQPIKPQKSTSSAPAKEVQTPAANEPNKEQPVQETPVEKKEIDSSMDWLNLDLDKYNKYK